MAAGLDGLAHSMHLLDASHRLRQIGICQQPKPTWNLRHADEMFKTIARGNSVSKLSRRAEINSSDGLRS